MSEAQPMTFARRAAIYAGQRRQAAPTSRQLRRLRAKARTAAQRAGQDRRSRS